MNKSIKYTFQRGAKGYFIATLVIEEQPNYYPFHITAPDWESWCARAKSVERRYRVLIETVF